MTSGGAACIRRYLLILSSISFTNESGAKGVEPSLNATGKYKNIKK